MDFTDPLRKALMPSPLVSAFRNNLRPIIPTYVRHARESILKDEGQKQAWIDHIEGKDYPGRAVPLTSPSQENPQFEEALKKLYDLQSHPPSAAAPTPLKMPNSAQLLAGGLTALLVPKFAATALASPFQAALVKHAEDEQKAALDAETAARAWQTQVGAAGDALSAIPRRGEVAVSLPLPSAAMPNTSVVPPRETGDEGQSMAKQVLGLMQKGDFKTAKELAAQAQAGLQGSRKAWISEKDALEIGRNESAGDSLRKTANDTYANLPKVGPLRTSTIKNQMQRNMAAWEATQKTLSDIGRQMAAVNDRLELLGQAPGTEEARGRLLHARDWLGTLWAEKQGYLKRLRDIIHDTEKRLGMHSD